MESKYAELSKASSADEILAVTRDFLSGCTRDDFDGLPDYCRPGRLSDPNDIERWADRLLGASKSERLVFENEVRLDRLTNHFLIASVRLRQFAP